ncbi:MAG: T9SS type A sorting domain-containing protein [Bacteroidetes bacterium]|nr:T9SS type A sorting domain-containing protein [Bacteroidota bacterium]
MNKIYTLPVFFILLLSCFYLQAQTRWPIVPQDSFSYIFGGYGMHEKVGAGNEYFHEGIDLLGRSNSAVLSVRTGRVLRKQIDVLAWSNGYYGQLIVSPSLAAADTNSGFGYLHLNHSNNIRRGRAWMVGDTAFLADRLGTVAPYFFPTLINPGDSNSSHLHFEYLSHGPFASWVAPGVIFDEDSNPAMLMTRHADTTKPVIRKFFYRYGQDEGVQAARYYTDSTASRRKVVKDGVDKIVEGGDYFGNFPRRYLLNYLKLRHQLLTINNLAAHPYVTAIDFSGRYLDAETSLDANRTSFNKLRNTFALVQPVYENDNTCAASFRVLTPNSGDTARRFYTILTNVDTVYTKTTNINRVKINNVNFYWDTKAKIGANVLWNNTYADQQADSNAIAKFPDGLYINEVEATGYGNSAADRVTKRDTIFVNNFNEFIFSCDSGGKLKDTFCVGKPVYIKGNGYPAGQSYWVYLFKDTALNDGMSLRAQPSRISATRVTADPSGRILPIKIWNAYEPNSFPDKGYDIVLDFDRDSLWTDPRVDNTVDTKDSTVPGGNRGRSIIGFDSLKVSLKVTNATCSTDSNGCIRDTVTGAKAPFTLRIKGIGNSYNKTFIHAGRDTTICGLKPGRYQIYLIGADSCQSKLDTVKIGPDSIKVLKTIVNATCNGTCNGSLRISISGGNKPYNVYWSDTAAVDTIRTGLCARTYYVTITDSNGCVKYDSVKITQPTALHTTAVITKPNCFGGCNGAITITATGGTAPYTYAWAGSTDVGRTRTNLCAGWYRVTITDNNLCTRVDSFQVTQPTQLNVSLAVTAVICPNTCTGKITATATGGTAPYTYAWSDTALNSKNRINLCIGTYVVTVTDSKGCTATAADTVKLSATALAVTGVTTANKLCGATANGSVTLTVTGGTTPYTYLWSGPNSYTSTVKNITALKTGTYNVTVRDNSGCSVTRIFNVAQDTLRASYTSVSNTVCIGNCNGSINVTAVGGTPGYTYNWSASGGYSANTANITGLCWGRYFVTITDQGTCTASYYVDLVNNAGNAMALTTSSTPNSSCNNSCNGSASVAVTGGNSPYSYHWYKAVSTYHAYTATASNLCSGAINVTVTDASTCTATATVNVINANTLTATVAITNNTNCNANNCNGSLTASASGGTSPYTYAWSNGATGATASSLCPGNYSVTITDATGCTFAMTRTVGGIKTDLSATTIGFNNQNCQLPCNGSATVNTAGGNGYIQTYAWSSGSTSMNPFGLCSVIIGGANPGIAASADATDNSSCAAPCNGSAIVTTTGANLPIQSYAWSNGANGETASELCIGTYTVTVTDNTGCTAEASTTVGGILATLSASAQASDNSSACGNTCDGSATVNVTGGNEPIQTYAWSSGSTSMNPFGLCPGVYTVTITDNSGCTATSSATVGGTALSNLSVTVGLGGNNTNCSEPCNGAVAANVSGGVAPFTYAWSNGGNTYYQTGLCPATYSVTVTDANGCSANASGDVGGNLPSNLSVTVGLGGNNTNCSEPCNGAVAANVSGGVAPFTYAWSNGGNTYYQTGLCPATYSVTVTDANGCSAIASGDVGGNPPSNLSVSVGLGGNNTNCSEPCNGAVGANVSGGVAPFTYSWSNGGNTYYQSGLCPATYSVTVTDANGCSAIASGDVGGIIPGVAATITGFSTANTGCTICNGAVSTSVTGSGSYTYNWYGSNGYTATDDPQISGLCDGSYTIVVTEVNGCSTLATFVVADNSVSPIISLTALHNDSCNTSSGSINISVTGGNEPYSYSWSDASSSQNATALLSGNYSVTVYDAYGCLNSAYYFVSETCDTTVIIDTTHISFKNDFSGLAPNTSEPWKVKKIFPNPFSDRLWILIQSPADDKMDVRMFDVAGKLVAIQKFGISNGDNTIEMNMRDLAAGVYVLELKTQAGTIYTRVTRE